MNMIEEARVDRLKLDNIRVVIQLLNHAQQTWDVDDFTKAVCEEDWHQMDRVRKDYFKKKYAQWQKDCIGAFFGLDPIRADNFLRALKRIPKELVQEQSWKETSR